MFKSVLKKVSGQLFMVHIVNYGALLKKYLGLENTLCSVRSCVCGFKVVPVHSSEPGPNPGSATIGKRHWCRFIGPKLMDSRTNGTSGVLLPVPATMG